jgi:hypothetical protein
MPRLCACVIVGSLLLAGLAARAADLPTARADLYKSYAAKLDQLALWCQSHEFAAAADELKAWLPEREPDKLTLFVLDSTANGTERPAAEQPQWRTRWQVLRNEQAEALAALAARAAAEHRPSLAYELLTETVRENPDHKLARRVLGYVRFRDAWHTPFEVKQITAGKVFHKTFGWIPKAHVDRYEQGQRSYRGRWMSAAEEQSLRGDLKRGWRIESDHYVVTTNHSLEAGAALSRRLELLYAVWQQAFAGYLAGDVELARRFEGRAARRDAVQHNVVYYRNRDEYNAALRSSQPKIDMSLGIYFSTARTAYFFAGDDQEPGTLYHEATHQLFQETRPVVAEPGKDSNFWIVEGIACYMESFAEVEGGAWVTLGGANAGRMSGARYRLLTDNYYVPLSRLVELGMESLQREPRIAELYGQTAGLADFFMHDRQGRYREALVRYLESIYAGRATAATLSELVEVPYATLDEQYREFMSLDAPSALGAR